MDLMSLIKKSRSYRRFDEGYFISGDDLRDLIRLAQFSPTGSNMQPLKFWLSNSRSENEKIFPHLGWAGALKDWSGPAEGERPSAYILILGDKALRKSFGVDHGIAAQSMMLGAAEKGLGGCMIGSANRQMLQKVLSIPDQYDILLVLALGKPAEEVVTDLMEEGDETRYYRDASDVHHVPKRPLSELIVKDVED